MNENTTASTEHDPAFNPKWENRLRTIISILVFCALVILYLMFFGEADSQLQETIVIGCFALGGATAASYLFNARYEDVARMKLR